MRETDLTWEQVSDMFLLLLPPGGGDELQGIKKGIVESGVHQAGYEGILVG